MKIPKYILSTLLIIWGLLIALAKLFSVGLHVPFLTIITIVTFIAGVSKYKKADTIFFISGCLWTIFSSETIGFVIFFDGGNYERMIVGIIPLLLGGALVLSSQVDIKFINSPVKKLFLIPIFMFLGIGSYIYKPTIEEVNCWYYLDDGKTYNVLFAETPERTFEVELSSDGLKKEIMTEALQYEGRNGYYCPETKVRVVTSFSKIISAKIISFRNSEIDKKINFNNPTNIPLDRVNGNLEILKPYMLRLWN